MRLEARVDNIQSIAIVFINLNSVFRLWYMKKEFLNCAMTKSLRVKNHGVFAYDYWNYWDAGCREGDDC